MGVLKGIKKRALTTRKEQLRRESVFLKVVHPRGYVEIFRQPITAGEIMRRYPRHCVTRPDFFEYPWIVVRPESVLVPGKVFYLVPHSNVDKVLKEKRREMQGRRTPRGMQEERYHSHRQHHHRGYEESYNGLDEQDSDNGSLYKSSFYELWREMQRRIHQPDTESDFLMDLGLDSSLKSGRPIVRSPQQEELQRVKSCLRKAGSDRKKLNLKVSFASPVIIPSSRRGSPSVQQEDLVWHV